MVSSDCAPDLMKTQAEGCRNGSSLSSLPQPHGLFSLHQSEWSCRCRAKREKTQSLLPLEIAELFSPLQRRSIKVDTQVYIPLWSPFFSFLMLSKKARKKLMMQSIKVASGVRSGVCSETLLILLTHRVVGMDSQLWVHILKQGADLKFCSGQCARKPSQGSLQVDLTWAHCFCLVPWPPHATALKPGLLSPLQDNHSGY